MGLLRNITWISMVYSTKTCQSLKEILLLPISCYLKLRIIFWCIMQSQEVAQPYHTEKWKYVCQDVPVDIIGVFFNFRFSGRKSQTQQKLILQTSTHLTLKVICSHNTAKNLSDFTNFTTKIILFGVRKNIALHHFLTPKNCIL